MAEAALLTKPAAAGISGFVATHPVTVAIVGGIAVGALTYYLMSTFFAKQEESEEEVEEVAEAPAQPVGA